MTVDLSTYLNELEAETFEIRDMDEVESTYAIVCSCSTGCSTSSTSCCSTTSCAVCSTTNPWG